MEYRLAAWNEYGDPVHVHVRTCWRCWSMIDLNAGSMEDHLDACHPPGAPAVPRHALRDDPAG